MTEVAEQKEPRETKLAPLADVVSRFVPDRCESLWVGGMHMHNVPMAMVRECIRQEKRFGTLYAGPSSSLAADLLIGAGLVDRVLVGYIGFEHLGFAPAFRRAAIRNSPPVEIVDVDSGSMLLGLQAGAAGQPFAPLPPGIERTDLPAASPDFFKSVRDPFTTELNYCVPAIRPTVALLHAQQADSHGNAIFKGSAFSDRLAAMASCITLLQVEGVLDYGQVLRYPKQTGIPGFLVSAMSTVTFGCHPTSSHRYYNFDDVHLRLYLQAANSESGFNEYLQNYVHGPAGDHEEYMRRVQNQDWSSIG